MVTSLAERVATTDDWPFGLTLADGRRAYARTHEGRATLSLDARADLRLCAVGPGAFESFERIDADALPPPALLPLLACVFSQPPRPAVFTLLAPASPEFAAETLAHGIFDAAERLDDGRWRFRIARGRFWDDPRMWLRERPVPGAGARPTKPRGEVYRRHMPRFRADYSIRAFDMDRDLATFNAWMNLDSVAHFWDQKGSRDEHRAYLESMAADPHMTSMVGCFDDEPFAYFEVYWAKEDRIAPFYDVDDFDRGVHLLVGDSKHQGPGKVEAWFRGLLHYMFLDEPRTRRIVGDPRVDHVRWIEYMEKQGFLRLREFDLPHKRSELVLIERETFFGEPWGGPR
ncbi:GNAT family N-acetyltransferase [Methylocella sp.]|uniref:GNAT family N-acetyltransferase n=1 Tax=Methylocella sp. TaxID=1978226 RepID=UPI0035AF1939